MLYSCPHYILTQLSLWALCGAAFEGSSEIAISSKRCCSYTITNRSVMISLHDSCFKVIASVTSGFTSSIQSDGIWKTTLLYKHLHELFSHWGWTFSVSLSVRGMIGADKGEGFLPYLSLAVVFPPGRGPSGPFSSKFLLGPKIRFLFVCFFRQTFYGYSFLFLCFKLWVCKCF